MERPQSVSRPYDESVEEGAASPWATINRSVQEFPTGQPTDALPPRSLSGDSSTSSLRIQSPGGETGGEEQEFILETRLARGGFGEVWRATQTALRRTIAIKRLRADRLTPNPDSETDHTLQVESAFYYEALITANLSHPNIAPIHDLGTDRGGRMLLAMKLVEGELWSERIRNDLVRLGVRDFLSMHVQTLADVAQAVHFAHSRGVVHRDLKPSQVIVGNYGEVQLMDWGLALVHDETAATKHLPRLMEEPNVPTRRNGMNPGGTPAYMAPEQTDSHCDRIGPHTDVFLLGSILYLLLTGHAPYADKDMTTSLNRAAAAQYTPLQEYKGERYLPPELVHLCTVSMNPEPNHRPSSAADFHKALTDYLRDSGRKWDSVQFTAQVRRTLERDDVRINDLEICDSLLGNAEGLWRENPDIEPLRKIVAATYAAMTTVEDATLAAAILRATRLHDNQLRSYLILHIERVYASMRRRKAFFTELIVAGVILFIALGIVMVRELMKLTSG